MGNLSGLRRVLIGLYPIAVVLLFSACHGDSDVTVIDFSKTVAVKHPVQNQSGEASFRVAVGAMISPRETAVHYHQLLDYIAGNLNRNIQLVQRKTYSEINELVSQG